jgi:hypothetical protein
MPLQTSVYFVHLTKNPLIAEHHKCTLSLHPVDLSPFDAIFDLVHLATLEPADTRSGRTTDRRSARPLCCVIFIFEGLECSKGCIDNITLAAWLQARSEPSARCSAHQLPRASKADHPSSWYLVIRRAYLLCRSSWMPRQVPLRQQPPQLELPQPLLHWYVSSWFAFSV